MSARSGQRGRQEWRRRLAVALVWAWGLLYAGAGAIAAAPTTGHTVVIEDFKCEPETLTVKRGETVTWINKDQFPHTATSPGVFDSHGIPPNRSWKYTAHKAAEYAYTCTLHPNMKGTLTVE